LAAHIAHHRPTFPLPLYGRASDMPTYIT
jgi:hypothetical protein